MSTTPTQAFLDACIHNELTDVETFLPFDNRTAVEEGLWHAASQGNIAITAFLLTKGANINTRNGDVEEFGRSPLSIAVQNGRNELAKYLISKGANVNIQSHTGASPLLIAIENGRTELAKYLISQGAVVSTSDKDGYTPLILASQHGNLKLCELFVEMGADVNETNSVGVTPLIVASMQAHTLVAKFLLAKGADPNQQTHPSTGGFTPLYCAVQSGRDAKYIDVLISAGANPTTPIGTGWTPLHVAAQEGGSIKIAEMLIAKGAQPNALNHEGETAIWIASQFGHYKLVEYLNSVGSNPNTPDNDGWTCLHIASQNGFVNVCEFLVSIGCNPHSLDKFSNTPLHIAARNGHELTVEFLIDCLDSHSINFAALVNQDGQTPIQLAEKQRHRKVADLLRAFQRTKGGNSLTRTISRENRRDFAPIPAGHLDTHLHEIENKLVELKQDLLNQRERDEFQKRTQDVERNITELVRDKLDLQGKLSENLCILCHQHIRDTVVLPCAHFLFCNECIKDQIDSSESKQCPHCHHSVSQLVVCQM